MPLTMIWCSAPGASIRDLRAMVAYDIFISFCQLFTIVPYVPSGENIIWVGKKLKVYVIRIKFDNTGKPRL